MLQCVLRCVQPTTAIPWRGALEGQKTHHLKDAPGWLDISEPLSANQWPTEPAPGTNNDDPISSAACTSTCWRVALRLAQLWSLCNQMISFAQLFFFLHSTGLFVSPPPYSPQRDSIESSLRQLVHYPSSSGCTRLGFQRPQADSADCGECLILIPAGLLTRTDS
ncbi:hypothetical protein CORC01_01195 [Colletotrichum orchidophilum]|uniref:Uncharacterized protein n=1 Tax=Colletotrichum orchidophilum TaxID=1209926 RepID=A0A1G4BQB9_9PEZI|nr:uncharacterized protein CORC01_01195 [Colletotrichum orchidophilum]OHF03476.1 hypothetical protein CORC01_01195 [Colletotrichum orchidophilum]